MTTEPRVILITGASRGIGRAIAWRLAQPGAVLLLNHYDREPEAAEQTLKDILERGAQGEEQTTTTWPTFRKTQAQVEKYWRNGVGLMCWSIMPASPGTPC